MPVSPPSFADPPDASDPPEPSRSDFDRDALLPHAAASATSTTSVRPSRPTHRRLFSMMNEVKRTPYPVDE
jgi:hypothetical protein